MSPDVGERFDGLAQVAGEKAGCGDAVRVGADLDGAAAAEQPGTVYLTSQPVWPSTGGWPRLPGGPEASAAGLAS